MASNSRNVFTESEKQCLLELIKKHNLDKSFTQGGTSMNKKKVSWLRLVEEFNSIETNGRRTENQLRKCWDNLKTRQKHLAKEKKERMRTGGGPFEPVPVAVWLGENLTEDALFEQTNMKFSHAIDSDTVPTQGPQMSRNSTQEFSIRQQTYEKATKREEELHSLKKKEREWMMMAAEEIYKKAKIERQAAEELLLLNQSKRKLIELQLLQMNHID